MTHIHWRRFAMNKIPCNDSDEFDKWLYDRWAEKDELLKHFERTGQLPAHDGYIKVGVGLGSFWEMSQVLASGLAAVVMWFVVSFGLRTLQGLVAVGKKPLT